ncbi:hypothetical protein L873DRAFT_759221 [Choiromyces venosus 120613-1]|uniref:Mitochondrial outer membrane transport complex Sam37/metaxin N-terminal domain-containing protein n=1 Tax=Choiromyces venosus 120613-1 TaxID=1336337 RepID=A0A3N4JUE3_9PEZI|nr:hypothetical protein L873DRAFT_759221 [Choiromyces venosus 120613-1]
MLELHIYSPPSSVLPSLTPPCIALLSYLLKTQQPGTWTLHASNNPYLPSPRRGLPALHDRDSGVWTSGFRASINYLHLRRRPSSSDGESAEVFALGNYIECEGGRVLDSYMFFTDANFDLLRGVIGRGIGGLARYWMPGVLRSEAVGRCGGVIPLASPAPSGSGSDGSALTAAALPKSRDQISVQEAAERIKQHSLADNFLSTLQSYLSSHPRASGNGNGSRRCRGWRGICLIGWGFAVSSLPARAGGVLLERLLPRRFASARWWLGVPCLVE